MAHPSRLRLNDETLVALLELSTALSQPETLHVYARSICSYQRTTTEAYPE